MKIVCIAGALNQPRVIKRITSLYEHGFNLMVYGFDRHNYNCNSFPEGIVVEHLGTLNDGEQFLHKFSYFKDIVKKIVRKEGYDNVVYYSFSLIITLFLKTLRVRYIYEISDIRYGYPIFKYIRPFIRQIDKRIIRNSLLTVMTSEGFKDYLFGDECLSNVIIQPNKLNRVFKKAIRPTTTHFNINNLKFAFIGAIRYPDTILRFAKVIGQYFPQHEFHFYGESKFSEGFKKETTEYSNVIYHGRFKNPEELTEIYSNIDIVVACYETLSLNERIAEPNKLYEAAYFLKPIVVSENCFLGKKVDSLGCGIAINAHSDNIIKNFISNITHEQLKHYTDQELRLTLNELIDDPQPICTYLEERME